MTIIHLPRTTYENRRFFYEDLEVLLTQGFLSHPVYVGGHSYHFRSLLPIDHRFIDTRVRQDKEDWQISFVASTLWNVDGVSLLEAPYLSQMQKKVFDYLKKIPKSILEKFFQISMFLSQRANRAVSDIEFFTLEEISHLMWKQVGRNISNFYGYDPSRFGLNLAQKVWSYYCEFSDLNEAEELRWEQSKFIASASNPEGVKKLQSGDSARKEKLEQSKKDRLDFFYYTKIGIVDESNVDRRTEVNGIRQSSSVEEMEDEYKRWVLGIKDEHDLIIDEYKKAVYQRYEEARKEREKQLEELQKIVEKKEEEMMGGTQMVGLKPHEIAEYLNKKGVKTGGVRRIYDTDPFTHKEELAKKYLEPEQKAPGFDISQGELRPVVQLSQEDRQAILEAYKNGK